jgi:hypothetical protein
MLSPAHRRSIHTSLAPILGDEETDALMSQFPASPSDEPATKHDLEVTIGAFRAEVHDLLRQMVMWMVTSIIAGMGLAAAVGTAFAG